MVFTIFECKLAIVSSEFTFTDQEVQEIFLDTIIKKEEDIAELITALKRNRPELLKKLKPQIKNLKKAG